MDAQNICFALNSLQNGGEFSARMLCISVRTLVIDVDVQVV